MIQIASAPVSRPFFPHRKQTSSIGTLRVSINGGAFLPWSDFVAANADVVDADQLEAIRAALSDTGEYRLDEFVLRACGLPRAAGIPLSAVPGGYVGKHFGHSSAEVRS